MPRKPRRTGGLYHRLTYCFEILIVAIADVTAFGIYMGVWFPTVPHWIWVLSVVLIICAVNLMSVKVFGELEFWFSFFKVATIIIMILAGFGIIIWDRQRRPADGDS